MKPVIFIILIILLPVCISIVYVINQKNQPVQKWYNTVLYWLAGYLYPTGCTFIHAMITEPDYRYKYGHSYLSLIESGNSGYITGGVMLLAGMAMLIFMFTERQQASLAKILLQALFFIVAAYYFLLDLFVYDVWLLILLPLFYTIFHGILLYFMVTRYDHAKPDKYYLTTGIAALCLSVAAYFKVLFAQNLFYSLPEVAPECFIVTAAAKGHPNIVKSYVKNDGEKIMNRQLEEFYAFEYWLVNHFPRFHQRLRKRYNVIGPVIARRLNAPWKADLMYFTLKPLQYMIKPVLIFFN